MLFAVSPAVGLAIVAAIVVGGSLLLRKILSRQQSAEEDPLGAMFRRNREANEQAQRDAVAAIPHGDPIKNWVERGGEIGWLGYSDYLSSVYFTEIPDETVQPVRAVSFTCNKEPNLKKLPPPETPFGVDLARTVVSDRVLQALAAYRNLAALSLNGKDSVNDASLNFIRQMVDLQMLGLEFTSITAKGFRALAELPNLRALTLSSFYEIDAAIGHLARMTGLTMLSLSSCPLSDDGLRELRGLVNLTHLNLSLSQVTDGGLPHLRPFTKLVSLNLSSLALTNEGLRKLILPASLQKLRMELVQEGFSGEGLSGLASAVNLRELSLSTNGMNGEGLQHLATLPALETLDLTANPLTDAGFAKLPPLPKLWRLNLSRVPITDASVPHLKRFTALREMNVFDTKLTLAGAEEVAAALPECVIQTSFPK